MSILRRYGKKASQEIDFLTSRVSTPDTTGESVALMTSEQITSVSGDDSILHITGRIMRDSKVGSVRYDWSAVKVEFALQPLPSNSGHVGSPEVEIFFDLNGGANFFSVRVDERPRQPHPRFSVLTKSNSCSLRTDPTPS